MFKNFVRGEVTPSVRGLSAGRTPGQAIISRIAGTAMALGVFACSHVAFAAQVLCPSTFVTDGTAKVSHFGIAGVLSAANLCEYTSPPDNSVVANATNVNAAAFFTKTDWLVVTGFSQLEPSNGQSGSFELATANFPTKEYMVVFKDGRDTNLIGFLLNEELDNEGVATAGKVKIAWTCLLYTSDAADE